MGKAQKTRQFIIEKTASLFNKKGYAVTTLSDIIEVTGLTKGSIYGNFRDKDEVVIEALRYNVDRLNQALKLAVKDKTTSLDQLLAFVDFYRNTFSQIMEEGGCPMLNAATESDDNLIFLKETVKVSFEGWQRIIQQIIQNGIDDGTFKENISVYNYTSIFIMLIEGAILLSRALNDTNQLTIALDRIMTIIEFEIKK